MGNKFSALAIGCEDGFPSVPRNDPSVVSTASCLNPSREEKAQCEGKCVCVCVCTYVKKSRQMFSIIIHVRY